MSGYLYREGCNTRYVGTGCGQVREHDGCPHGCGICGKSFTGSQTPDASQGHSFDEVYAATQARRGGAGP